ncbi:hypothetical protein L2E82_05543 [Cichorium intybus]|uniref:Uncharacterized protein n=3 Tax=Cichorium intybus TaxID=13427 RepID=A0ACB9H9Q9_CICIN|nr:hypothetical protein L2E82_39623 [Cichorium intybus]KAI3788757.1 hypothetical protein L2E82_01532 [Cichorium intybus]KAI3791682.1 hypothetical protein L2E82_05543 [Cichorium intybus]
MDVGSLSSHSSDLKWRKTGIGDLSKLPSLFTDTVANRPPPVAGSAANRSTLFVSPDFLHRVRPACDQRASKQRLQLQFTITAKSDFLYVLFCADVCV